MVINQLPTIKNSEISRRAAIMMMQHIYTKWHLSGEEAAALGKFDSTSDEPLSEIEKRCAIQLIEIYSALHTLLPDSADDWIRKPNKAFDGVDALSVMLNSPDGINDVRKYLLGQLN